MSLRAAAARSASPCLRVLLSWALMLNVDMVLEVCGRDLGFIHARRYVRTAGTTDEIKVAQWGYEGGARL